MTRKRSAINVAIYRDRPKLIAKILNDALATGDTTVVVRTIGDLLRAHGMSEFARKTGLNRRTLYTSFGGEVTPNLDRVLKTLAALKVELVAKPIRES
jgi:probable addiction module antidote protein